MSKKEKTKAGDVELGTDGNEKRKDQAKLPILKIYVNISCGLNPGTEREGYMPGFIVTKVHLKIE